LFEEVQARTRELQESLDYQTATSNVLNVISRSPSNIQPVLDTIVETAARLCDAERAFIYRHDGAVLHLAASHNASPELIEFAMRNPISPGRHSGAARAALEKLTIHIPDVRCDPEYTFGGAQVGGIRTLLAVPMLKASDLIGVLVIYRLEVRPFTTGQVEMVTTFADQAVIAMENSRLLTELRESLQQQTATADVLKVISRSTFDLKAVLNTLIESAVRLCDAEKGTITRSIDGVFYRTEAYGFSTEFVEYIREIPVVPERGSASGRALLERRLVHIPDVEADPY
jgi:GAF domain-containing protein